MPKVTTFPDASTPLNDADILYLIQGGNSRKATVDDLFGVPAFLNRSAIRPQTALAASGTTVDFTGIPSWANRVTLIASGLSTNGTSVRIVQVGNGAFVTTGYVGGHGAIAAAAAGAATITSGFALGLQNLAADTFHGTMTLNRLTGNTWVAAALGGGASGNFIAISGYSIALAGALDRLRVTTVTGADTFDAGTVNVTWE